MEAGLRRELSRAAEKVDRYLERSLKGEPELLYRAAYHLVGAGGKRIRPFMTIQFYRAFREDEDDVIPAAASLELLHNFTLVHDDIMDRDDFRRGVPTVHKVYGEPIAILAGDALFAKAYEAMLDSKALRRNPAGMMMALSSMTNAAMRLCEGQTLDYELSKGERFDLDDYYRLISLKTSTLFVASAEIGVIAASVEGDPLEAARGYAENLGLAFQMVDDLLGVIGDPSVTGKPVGSDIREGKKTLPIMMALERLPKDDSSLLRGLWGAEEIGEEAIVRVVEAIRRSGVGDDVKEIATSYVERAIGNLDGIPEGGPRSLLEDLARFVVGRSY